MVVTVLIILVCIALLAILLWGVICTSVLRFVHKLKGLSKQEWLQTLIAYIKERSRRQVFYAFLTAETTIAGGFIPLVGKVWFSNSDCTILLEIVDQSTWVSVTVAVLIAVGFFIFLYFTDKKQPEKWNKIIDGARFINEEAIFIPSKEWFDKQNRLAIKALGNRYSPDINFPFDEMDWLLATLRNDDGLRLLIWDELEEVDSHIKSYLRQEKHPISEETKRVCQDVASVISSIEDEPSSYIELREKVKLLLDNLHDYSIHKEDYSDFQYRDLREKVEKLNSALSKIWFDINTSKCWIIAGEAGIGKSHLLADIVCQRKRIGEPSVLLLGQQFTKSADPLTQIKEKLDIRLTKAETMLNQLNNYGKRVGKPVTIFIDALNEGDGADLWVNYWDEFIARIEEYDYLRLVVSFRISGNKNWFYDLAYNQDKVPVFLHEGFKGNEQRAAEFLFRSYGLEQPLWPAYGSEFANPLFLKTYCRLHEKTGEPLKLDNFWITINKYCKWVNHELSQKQKYSDSLPLVTDALHCIAQLMVENGSRWHLEYRTVNKALVNVAELFNDPKDFMRIMVDEGLLRVDTYDNKDYVNFGYELIGDFFLANCLLNQGKINDDKWWSLGDGVADAMAVVAPLEKGVEAFELVEQKVKQDALNSMLSSSGWRETFTDKGKTVMTKLFEMKEYDALFSVILKRPFRNDDTANSEMLYNLLWPLSMSERDRIWTLNISEEWGDGRMAMELAKWGMYASPDALLRVDTEALRRCAETLVWIFTSTWRQLRDTSTHALVNLLAERKELILPLLTKFYKINDPYVEERLWASVLGALTCCQDSATASKVAEWVYFQIFESKHVPENILVRDYAKGIIRYAQLLDSEIYVNEQLLSEPFTDGVIPEVMTCDDIKAKYDNDEWDKLKEAEKDEWRAKERILSSMATEHSPRTNMYGDFGRYIFQSSIRDFPVDPEDMANWAIQMIFEEFGYNPKVFAFFDTRRERYDRSRSDVERIGKKYQWIAMYRILARLTDAYPDLNYDDSFYTPTQSARNIDPTYRIDTSRKDRRRSKYEVPKYDVTKPQGVRHWLRDWKKMPDIEKYLITQDDTGIEWINLFSYNTIKCPKSYVKQNGVVRDVWTFIQAFVVKTEYIKTVCKQVHSIGLEGRDFRENRDIDGIYSREFYWSDTYRERVKEEYYGFAPFSLGRKAFSDIEIAPAYLIYNHSSSEDASKEDGVEILMPNEWLYRGMQLKYGKANGVWVDKDGEIVAMDNSEYGKGHSALLIRKDKLLDYLNREGLTLFWPVLNERQARFEHGGTGLGYEQNGGWAYMDENGLIHHQFRLYAPTEIQKIKGRIRDWWMKLWIPVKYETLLWLHKKRIIRLPESLLWKILGLGPSNRYYTESPLNIRRYNKLLKQLEEEGKIVDNDNLSAHAEDVDSSFQKLLELSSQWDDDLEEDDNETSIEKDSEEM